MTMKKTFLALALVSSAFSTNLAAADIEAGIVNNVVDYSVFMQDDPLYISSSDLLGIEVSPTSRDEVLAKSINARGPAEGITYFEIAGVQSVSYPNIDPVSPNQTSTTQNHGGGQVRVLVFQFGYGNTNNATFAGSSVSATSSTPRCGANLTTCSAGQIVTGFLHQFDFSGASDVSGTVNVSANSIASPFGFWSDSVFIQ